MTSDRAAAIARFLTHVGWCGATQAPLAGDASSRRYVRLRMGNDRAVLMDAHGDRRGLERFIAVTEHLLGCGLSAPRVLAADVTRGLLLLEDFGDGLYPALLAADPGRETLLFTAATDVLAALHACPTPSAPDLGPDTLTEQAGLVYDSYLPAFTGRDDRGAKRAMQVLMAEAFAALPRWSPVLALRDFHAGNLFWLPDRPGPARVGLIDYQDAGLGHPLYDLVSLARDARRDVAPETVTEMQARYAAATGLEPGAAWPVLAVQRNLRILGIFARLALDHGKPAYLDFLPRTWALLVEDLEHASLTRLKKRILTDLPPPTPNLIARLKGQ
ncbi:MAG TPA: aminoglycoside phosphotransferase [Rhodobacteraceae bacterium]|nr:aminoglycoside phosphotransferase [Paracoccaceae bacterium]